MRRLRAACVTILVATGACRAFDSSADGAPATGGADGGPTADGAIGGPIPAPSSTVDRPPPSRCNPRRPFAKPARLADAINTPDDEVGARLSADELTLVFARVVQRTASRFDTDLFIVTRATRNEPFGTPRPLTELNSSSGEYDPFLLSNGLTIYFASDRPDYKLGRLYVASRATVADAFGPPSEVVGFPPGVRVGQPFFLPDDTTFFFSAFGASPQCLAPGCVGEIQTGRILAGTATSLEKVPGVSGYHAFPTVTGDGLTMLLSQPIEDTSSGTWETVRVVKRASRSDPFGGPVDVPELMYYDVTWMASDGCVVLAHAAFGSAGKHDIFIAQRGND